MQLLIEIADLFVKLLVAFVALIAVTVVLAISYLVAIFTDPDRE